MTQQTEHARAERVFLGWEGAVLERAAARIADFAVPPAGDAGSGAGSADLDLSRLLVLVPGRRAGRHLLAMLIDEAARRGRGLLPPEILTPGRFLERVAGESLGGGESLGEGLTLRLAWLRAAEQTDRAELEPLLPIEADLDALGPPLAEQLQRIVAECAQCGILPGDVPDIAGDRLPPAEAERWDAIETLRVRAAEVLRSWRVADPVDRAWELLPAGRAADIVRARWSRAVLVCCPEIPRIVEHLLSGFERLDALIAAPPDHADLFDPLGRPDTDAWAEQPIELAAESVLFAQDDEAQAERALACLAEPGAPAHADEVCLVTPDADAASAIARLARRTGTIEVHAAAGIPLVRTHVYRLLHGLAALARDRRLSDVRPLLHNPLAHAWLETSADDAIDPPHESSSVAACLAELDALERTRPGAALDAELILAVGAHDARLSEPQRRTLRAPFDRMLGAADRLADARNAPGGTVVRRVLADILEHVPLDADDPAEAIERNACAQIASLLDQVERLERTDPQSRLSAGEAATLVLADAERLHAATVQGPEALEMIGWLDAWLDPSSLRIVASVAEGSVPSGGVSDAFLPDALRSALGLATDRSRLACDAYRLRVLRERPLRLLCPRFGSEGDPAVPSRLLFRDPDPGTNAERALAFAESKLDSSVRIARDRGVGDRSLFPRQPAPPARVPRSLPVTSFRLFLASPYLFYVRYLARADAVEASSRELDAGSFGHLAHEALRGFASSDAAREDGAERIRAALLDALADEARARLGLRPCVAVRIQRAFLERRLAAFAERQARWRGQGWRIEHVEWEPSRAISIDAEGGPMGLTGRIDRIDLNEATGELAILDYKTGEKGQTPDQTHRRGPQTARAWVDLQLPLYRRLAGELPGGAGATVGYVTLPRDPEDTEFRLARWTDADFAQAEDTARRVIAEVRAAAATGDFPLGDTGWARGSVAALAGIGLAPEDPVASIENPPGASGADGSTGAHA